MPSRLQILPGSVEPQSPQAVQGQAVRMRETRFRFLTSQALRLMCLQASEGIPWGWASEPRRSSEVCGGQPRAEAVALRRCSTRGASWRVGPVEGRGWATSPDLQAGARISGAGTQRQSQPQAPGVPGISRTGRLLEPPAFPGDQGTGHAAAETPPRCLAQLSAPPRGVPNVCPARRRWWPGGCLGGLARCPPSPGGATRPGVPGGSIKVVGLGDSGESKAGRSLPAPRQGQAA